LILADQFKYDLVFYSWLAETFFGADERALTPCQQIGQTVKRAPDMGKIMGK